MFRDSFLISLDLFFTKLHETENEVVYKYYIQKQDKKDHLAVNDPIRAARTVPVTLGRFPGPDIFKLL